MTIKRWQSGILLPKLDQVQGLIVYHWSPVGKKHRHQRITVDKKVTIDRRYLCQSDPEYGAPLSQNCHRTYLHIDGLVGRPSGTDTTLQEARVQGGSGTPQGLSDGPRTPLKMFLNIKNLGNYSAGLPNRRSRLAMV